MSAQLDTIDSSSTLGLDTFATLIAAGDGDDLVAAALVPGLVNVATFLLYELATLTETTPRVVLADLALRIENL